MSNKTKIKLAKLTSKKSNDDSSKIYFDNYSGSSKIERYNFLLNSALLATLRATPRTIENQVKRLRVGTK